MTNTAKIVCINLLSSNKQAQDVSEYLEAKSPDLVVLQEFTREWEARLESTLSKYRYRLAIPRTDNFGIAVYSKTEWRALHRVEIGEAYVPSISGQFLINNQVVTLIATHPLPPVGGTYFDHRNKQLEDLGQLASDVETELIVIGDLNTSSFSKHFQKLLKAGHLIDSRRGFGLLTTWPTWLSLVNTTLDHCLISSGIDVKSREVGPDIGSDHLPIYVELGIE